MYSVYSITELILATNYVCLRLVHLAVCFNRFTWCSLFFFGAVSVLSAETTKGRSEALLYWAERESYDSQSSKNMEHVVAHSASCLPWG